LKARVIIGQKIGYVFLYNPMRILTLCLAAVLSACSTIQPVTPTYPPGVKEAPKALVDDQGRSSRLLESFSDDSIAAVLEKDGPWKIVSKSHPIKAFKLSDLSEFDEECYAVKKGDFWVVVKKS
jgi:hypothetical protein